MLSYKEQLPTFTRYVSFCYLRVIVGCISAIIGTLGITAIIYCFKLYPLIPNISIVYLLLILFLASVFGSYSALLSSITAFLSFDYFIVPPIYTLTIDRWEEWIALFVFLVTSLLTSQLTLTLRQRTAFAEMREYESRSLYELMKQTNKHEQLDEQLDDVVTSCVRLFAPWGVRACAVLLPDPLIILETRAIASLGNERTSLTMDEDLLAMMALNEQRFVEERFGPVAQEKDRSQRTTLYRSLYPVEVSRFIPLVAGDHVLGVLYLRLRRPVSWFASKTRMREEESRPRSRMTFFWTFVEQLTSLLERAALRYEADCYK